MANLVRNYFDGSDLSLASYATMQFGMAGGAYVTALVQAGMSVVQARDFAGVDENNQFVSGKGYTILDQRPNTAEGFSATVFQKGDQYFLAIRGTEDFFTGNGVIDWTQADIADIGKNGIAIAQAIDLFNYYQDLSAQAGSTVFHYAYSQTTNQVSYTSTVASQTGALFGRNFTVTGHSLGGHLALIMSRLTPDRVSFAYTYNAPGFDSQILNSLPGADAFFNSLRQAEISARGASSIAGSFDVNKLSNLVVPEDVVHDVGTILGERLSQYSEGGGANPKTSHDIDKMTDALAVYALLSMIDPAKTTGQILNSGAEIFKASANTSKATLEAVINALGDVFEVGDEVDPDNRDQLYQRVFDLGDALTDANTGALKSQYQGLSLIDLVGLSAAQVAAVAGSPSEDGADEAFRYALTALNPFAIAGGSTLYAPHDEDGELDLYDVSNDSGLTDKWLQDRAALLAALIRYNTEDRNDQVAPGDTAYFDAERQIRLRPFAPVKGIAFANAGEQLSGRNLAPEADLFGSEGDDTILGSAGKSYVEGGAGDDTVTTFDGNDEVHGGAGNDAIDGGAGNDLIIGGKGDDTLLDGGADSDTIWGDEQEGSDRYAGANYGGNDTLKGGDGTDILYGGGGDDRLEGGEGNDDLYGDGQDPTDAARTGIDTLVGGAGIDILYGGAGDDKLYGDEESPDSSFRYADVLYGNAGDDTLYGGGGNDQLFGDNSDPNDTAASGKDTLVGGFGSDTLYGGGGDDELYGDRKDKLDISDSSGNDQLFGGEGNDKLYGGAGRDYLEGGAGDDTLRGGAGVADYMVGGAGNDGYYYNVADGADLIWDEDGSGYIFFETDEQGAGQRLAGGKNESKGSFVYYDDPKAKNFTYTASSDPNAGPITLTITSKFGGELKVFEFSNDQLGIHLADGNDDPTDPDKPDTPPVQPGAQNRGDPLIVDLGNPGISTYGLSANLHSIWTGMALRRTSAGPAPRTGCSCSMPTATGC